MACEHHACLWNLQFGQAYAGLLTFGGLPYTEDPAELEGVDVAIVGAPTGRGLSGLGPARDAVRPAWDPRG